MKPTAVCLCLLILAGAGCIGPLKGTKDANLPKPPPAEFAEPPTPVDPEEINDSNARSMLRRLEEEIRYDEQQASRPAEPVPVPTEEKKEQPQKPEKQDRQDKPKKSGRPWGPTWG